VIAAARSSTCAYNTVASKFVTNYRVDKIKEGSSRSYSIIVAILGPTSRVHQRWPVPTRGNPCPLKVARVHPIYVYVMVLNIGEGCGGVIAAHLAFLYLFCVAFRLARVMAHRPVNNLFLLWNFGGGGGGGPPP